MLLSRLLQQGMINPDQIKRADVLERADESYLSLTPRCSIKRLEKDYLYHIESGTRVPLGSFHAPDAYRGEWRCDLHPRSSPDGRWVVIDSAHGGDGRQLYLIDVGDIVD